MAEVFLFPAAIKLAFFAGKCSKMGKRSKRSCFWSIADHFEVIKKFHFTAPVNFRHNSSTIGKNSLGLTLKFRPLELF